MIGSKAFLLAVTAGFLAVNHGNANMIITPTFDSTITGDTNAASIESTINSAISQYESMFSNNITVSIYFQEMTSGLGQSNTVTGLVNYSTFYNALVATNANPAALAALTANGGAGTNNPVTGTTGIEVKTADLRAVGLSGDPACIPTAPVGQGGGPPNVCSIGSGSSAVDGIISLNTSITSPPGVLSSSFGLLAVVEHEIDEVLGLGSALNNCNPGDPNATAACAAAGNWTFSTSGATDFTNTPAPEDLYRWNAATGGTRSAGTNCQTPTSAFFNYGPSTGNIAQFNNVCNGADFGDWTGNTSPSTQDAFATGGANPSIGTEEIAALTAVGYVQTASQVTPEPATFGLLGLSLVGVVVMRRRTARP